MVIADRYGHSGRRQSQGCRPRSPPRAEVEASIAMTAALLRAMPLIPGIAGRVRTSRRWAGCRSLVNCAAGKLVAVTWKEKAEAVMAGGRSAPAGGRRGRP